MLVLSRKSMECIRIGDNVVVSVLEIRGNKVRIGIDAPREIQVLRTELLDQVSDASGDSSRGAVTSTGGRRGPNGNEGRVTADGPQ